MQTPLVCRLSSLDCTQPTVRVVCVCASQDIVRCLGGGGGGGEKKGIAQGASGEVIIEDKKASCLQSKCTGALKQKESGLCVRTSKSAIESVALPPVVPNPASVSLNETVTGVDRYRAGVVAMVTTCYRSENGERRTESEQSTRTSARTKRPSVVLDCKVRRNGMGIYYLLLAAHILPANLLLFL